MNNEQTLQRFTMAEALDIIRQYGACPVKFSAIDTDEATITASVDKFKWLCGLTVDSGFKLLRAAEADVLVDVDLFLMLTLPARRFAKWFKKEQNNGILEDYEMSKILGDDVNWAVGVLERANVLIEAEGIKRVQ